MGLIRFIILALVIWLVWRMYQIHKDRSARKPEGEQKSISGGKMVKCAHCGTHLPRRNALPQDDLWFCSREHRQQHEDQ